MMKTLVVAALSLVATAAHAQPTGAQASVDAQVPELKSERSATAAAVAGTLAPIAVLGAAAAMDEGDVQTSLAVIGSVGLLVAPSAGHWYSGKLMTKGMALRLGGIGVATTSLIAGRTLRLGEIVTDEDHNGNEVLIGGLVVGGGLVVAGIIYDIATADDAAREYNRKQARTLTVAPTMTNDSAGFAIAGTF